MERDHGRLDMSLTGSSIAGSRLPYGYGVADVSPGLDALYADSGRPSIAPECILRALLLQVFYSVRSDRLLVEQIDYNLLFRWFMSLGMDDAVWNHAMFSKNRDRLLTSDVAQQIFAEVNQQARLFYERRTLHGGSHADLGVGLTAELSLESRL